MTAFEYKVSWRRADWSPASQSKTRTFARRKDAERFAARLRTPYRGLGCATVRVHHRPVGAWREGWPE